MKKILAALAIALLPSLALAQSNPGLTFKQVPTAGQWNSYFSAKQDTLGYTPLNVAGGVMSGRLVTAAPGATVAGLNMSPGTTPAAPADGDIWTTSGGLFVQINGTTIGPISGPSGGSFAATAPLAVSFPAGVTTYACSTCGVTTSPLSQFAATTSAQMRGVISDETGGGLAVFNSAPTIISPVITTSFTATGLVGLTNLAAQTANTVVLNGTSGSASPVAYPMPGCTGPANAMQWTTNTGFTCGVITAAASSVAIGTTTITGGTTTRVMFNNAGVLGEYTITGTGNVAMSAGPTFTGTITAAAANFSGTTNHTGAFQIAGVGQTFPTSGLLVGTTDTQTLSNKTLTAPIMTTPTLGVAIATSLAIGGATIGSNGLAVTGTAAISSTLTSTAHAITSASANALVVGVNGATNPAFNVDASTASSVTGINIKSAAAAAGVALSVISSGTNENMFVDAKGSGGIAFGNTSTGAMSFARPVTFSGALTYGGVTLSNAVTGTGPMVLGASPTFTGTVTMAALNMSGALAVTSASANALAVGLAGTTNPAFSVDASTASSATGISIKSAAAAAGVAIFATSSGTNEAMTINAKGSGNVSINNTSTGTVAIGGGGGGVNINSAISYAGVTFANAVTGTGSLVGSIAPTITGHPTIEGVTSTGASGTGNFVFSSNSSISNLTVTSAFTATGLVTYAALNSAAIATTANYFAGAASVLVPASAIYQAPVVITYGATTTFNFATFNDATVTLTGNITTQTLTGVTPGKSGTIAFSQDATGSRTTVWNSIFLFASGVQPVLSTTPGATDILSYTCRSAGACIASLIKDVR